MSGEMLGADPEDLRKLAKFMVQTSEKLQTSANSVASALDRSRWQGNDAQDFKHQFAKGIRPQLRDASSLLKSTSDRLVKQARDQEIASAAEGEGSIGPDGKIVTSEEAKKQRETDLRNQLDKMRDASPEDVKKWWDSLSDKDKQYLLAGNADNGVPLAERLAALGEKLPIEAQRAAHDALVEKAKGTIPVYKGKDSLGIEGHVAWVHGGAHVGTEVTKNADGSATLKVYGDLGGGVNVPGNKDTGVTLTGEVSKTYKFNSLEDAQAARDQMLRDLPPDSFGKAKDVVENPGRYLVDTLNNAARDHGMTGVDDKLKGTASFSAGGKLSDDVKGTASLDLGYEQNMTDGTSVASGAVKANAKLDLGDGLKLGGSGEVSVDVAMDKNHDVSKLTLNVKGTVEGSMSASDTVHGAPGEDPIGVNSLGLKGGMQATARIEVYNTPENQALVQSYLGNMASGNDAAATADLGRLYQAGGVTLQTNAVSTTESNPVDVDLKAASLKVGVKSEETSNLSTHYKAPHSTSYDSITAAARKN